jgi:hypothetical protein
MAKILELCGCEHFCNAVGAFDLEKDLKKMVSPYEDFYHDVVLAYHPFSRGFFVSQLKKIGLSLSIRSYTKVGFV